MNQLESYFIDQLDRLASGGGGLTFTEVDSRRRVQLKVGQLL